MQTPTKLRKLTREDVEITIEIDNEWLPLRGNAIATGDPDYDRQVEDELLKRLDSGDIWAWCSVTVTARWNGFEGKDHLGGCSYADEEDFKRSGYYDEMVGIAIDELNKEIERQYAMLSELIIKPSPAQQVVSEAWKRGIDLEGWDAVEHYITKTVNEMYVKSTTVPDPYASSPERSELLGEALRLASERYYG